MSKKLVTSYTFTAASKTIASADFTSLEKIQLITNVTDNIIIYNFADATKGGTLSGTTLTLTYDTTSMADADKLQIFVEDAAQTVPVTDNGSTLSIDDGGGTITVDGSLTVDLGANNDVTVTSGAITETNSAAIKTAVETIDNAIAGTEMQVDVVAALPAGTNNIGDVDVVSSALPTGASTLAEQQSQTTHLATIAGDTTDIEAAVELIDDTVATLGTTTYTEAASKGLVIGAVRRDADTTLVDTTNEVAPLQVDANGRLKVEAFSGEALPVTMTSTTVTGTVAVTQSGTWDEVGINDSGNSITVDNSGTFATQATLQIGDNTVGRVKITDGTDVADVLDLTNSNPVATAIVDGNGDQITSFGGGTQYTEDAAAAANPVGTALMLVREDGRAGSLTTTDGDNVAARGNNKGELYVKSTDSDALLTTIDADTGNISTKIDTVAGAVSGTEMQVDVVGALPAGTNNIGDVDVLTLPGVAGTVADNAADSGNPIKVGAKYNATQPTYDDGDRADLQVNSRGELIVRLYTASNAIAAVVTNTDAVATSSIASKYQVASLGYVYNGTTFDRMRGDTTGTYTVAKPTTSGGQSIFRSIDIDESEEEIKATAGQLYWISAFNRTAAPLYLKFYNATAANVTVGTTTPVMTFVVPGNADSDGAGFVLNFGDIGVAFGTAISVACTTGVADNDTGAPGANDCVINIGYA